MQIEIDFDVFKALTIRRESENVSCNDVLRDLLGLNSGSAKSPSYAKAEKPLKALLASESLGGYAFRGGFLPNGTKLKALYKNRIYTAEIIDGSWLSEDGVKHGTPSAAVTHITGTATNAGRFWNAKRPGDSEWHRLNSIPSSIL